MPRSDVHHFPVRSIGFSVTHDINKFIRTSMISTVFGSSRILPLNSPTWHSDYVSDMLKPSILIDINSIHTPNAVYATLLLCSFDQSLGLSPVLFCENDLVLAFPNRFNRKGSLSFTLTPPSLCVHSINRSHFPQSCSVRMTSCWPFQIGSTDKDHFHLLSLLHSSLPSKEVVDTL